MNDSVSMNAGGEILNQDVPKQSNVIDLASIDTIKASNAGAEIELRHPVTNAPLGVFITVLGKDSDAYREFQRHKFNDYLRNEAMAKARGKQPTAKSAEDYEDDMLTLLVSCTKGWRNVVFNAVTLPFTAENVRRIYKSSPYVRDQINDAVGDLGNFVTS